ncbi:MAG: hypothetical protein KJ077_29750 [Anaerolineae bacterium]|nr:hypothetical protein [Anaerolineae bacterium]
MVEQIRLLQAEIRANLASIRQVYQEIDALGPQATGSQQDIVRGYYIHVLYGLFENLFVQIAEQFGNNIADTAQWHTQLLKRMTLDIKPIRPPVISQETYICLNELRSFRHLFRNAYLLQFDPERLNLVLREALTLESIYEAEMNAFLDFLEQLAQTDT